MHPIALSSPSLSCEDRAKSGGTRAEVVSCYSYHDAYQDQGTVKKRNGYMYSDSGRHIRILLEINSHWTGDPKLGVGETHSKNWLYYKPYKGFRPK